MCLQAKGGEFSVKNFGFFPRVHGAESREHHSLLDLAVGLQSCDLPEIRRPMLGVSEKVKDLYTTHPQ